MLKPPRKRAHLHSSSEAFGDHQGPLTEGPHATHITDGGDEPWRTKNHEHGYCAMMGQCGTRSDGDFLNCPANRPAWAPKPDLAAALQATCPTLWQSQVC
jgi:hypothetical protein